MKISEILKQFHGGRKDKNLELLPDEYNVETLQNFADLIKIDELEKYNGFGFCAYGSKLLSDLLTKHGIDNKILIGRGIVHDNYSSSLAKLIMNFDEPSDSIYSL